MASLQLKDAAAAADTLARVAKEEWARLRGLPLPPGPEVCSGALARLRTLPSAAELARLVAASDIAVVATAPAPHTAGDHLELLEACDAVPGARRARCEGAAALLLGAPVSALAAPRVAHSRLGFMML